MLVRNKPCRLLHGHCPGLTFPRCHAGRALSRWVSPTVPADLANRTQRLNILALSSWNRTYTVVTRVTKQPDATRGTVQDEGQGGGNVDSARASELERNPCCQGNVEAAPAWGKTIIWGKVTQRRQRTADERGLGVEMSGWGGRQVERMSGRKSVSGSHGKARPVWEVRPQLGSHALRRLRGTAQHQKMMSFSS